MKNSEEFCDELKDMIFVVFSNNKNNNFKNNDEFFISQEAKYDKRHNDILGQSVGNLLKKSFWRSEENQHLKNTDKANIQSLMNDQKKSIEEL